MAGFCTNCGQPLTEGAAFCTRCGQKVVAPSAHMGQVPAGQQPLANMSAPMAGQPQPSAPPSPPLQAGPGNEAPPSFWLKLRREKQWYLVNPAVDVTIDQGQPFGIENGQELVFPIAAGPHHLHFSCHVRSHDMDINVQGNMCVNLGWNRLWGSLEAEVQPF